MQTSHSKRSGRFTILCVEDEADLRADVAEELVAAGHAVLEAADGRQALAMLDRYRPDLILCDITMPGMGGHALLETVWAEHPHLNDVPFVFLTALADRKDVIHGKNIGADDYLVKPIDYDILLATVRARLNQVRRMRATMSQSFEQQRQDLLQKAMRGALASVASAFDRMSVGIVLLDGAGTILLENESARVVLERADGLVRRQGVLRAIDPEPARILREAIEGTSSSGTTGRTIAIPRSTLPALAIQTFPLERQDEAASPAVAVIVIDPEQRPQLSPELAAQLYGLTRTEARLASALAEGKRLEQVGSEFGVSQTTVVFHLQNLFRKTQTSRQVDLVALLMRSALFASDKKPGPRGMPRRGDAETS